MGLLWLIRGSAVVKDQFLTWLVFTGCAFVIVEVGRLVLDWFRAPHLMYVEHLQQQSVATGQIKALEHRLEPRLQIIFKRQEEPFDQTYDGIYQVFRVGVISPVPVEDAVLRVDDVRIGDQKLFDLHLHYMHDTTYKVKRVKLYANYPDYWDVVTRESPHSPLQLEHIHRENVSMTLSRDAQQFKITASVSDSWPMVKIMKVGIAENNEIVFNVSDVEPNNAITV
jgi:hypothetical protein